jgi:hypothetical protein
VLPVASETATSAQLHDCPASGPAVAVRPSVAPEGDDDAPPEATVPAPSLRSHVALAPATDEPTMPQGAVQLPSDCLVPIAAATSDPSPADGAAANEI